MTIVFHTYQVKYLYTADALSRAPLKTLTPELDTESFVQGVVANLPADSDHLEEYRKAQRSDPLTAKIIQFCQSQWPGRSRIENDLVPYWRVRSGLSVVDGLLLFGSREYCCTKGSSNGNSEKNSLWTPGSRSMSSLCCCVVAVLR